MAIAFEAALDWWREAGVSADFADSPTDWLAREAPVDAPATVAPVATAASKPPPAPIEPIVCPASLAEFAPWWLSEPRLDGGRINGRIPPRGPAGAALMIIVPEPEHSDTDSLLSGADGRLLGAMLVAMGIRATDTYFASILPRCTPIADWDGVEAAGLGDVLAHHIDLVGPKRILCLTGNALPLPRNRLPNSGETLRRFNQEGGTVPVFVSRNLAALRERPRWRAAFWQTWLEWTRGDE